MMLRYLVLGLAIGGGYLLGGAIGVMGKEPVTWPARNPQPTVQPAPGPAPAVGPERQAQTLLLGPADPVLQVQAEELPPSDPAPLPLPQARPYSGLPPMPPGAGATADPNPGLPPFQLPPDDLPPAPAGPSMLRPGSRPFIFPGEEDLGIEVLRGKPLAVQDVLLSVERYYPLLEAAMREQGIAEGDLLAAWGAYDLELIGKVDSTPIGFYPQHTSFFGAEQLTRANGARFFAGYKLGRGSFAPWELGDNTNDGGEFQLGYTLPLLQGQAIDKPRAELFKAQISLAASQPKIFKSQLEFTKAAAKTYWSWLAAGLQVEINAELLRIAEIRNRQLIELFDQGAIPELDVIDNQRVILDRQGKLIETERKFQQAALQVSLFLRDRQGRPVVPTGDMLPIDFPRPPEPQPEALDEGIQVALSRRPEIRDLRLQAEKFEVELALANNQRLPKLDLQMFARQDAGASTSSKEDKDPFQWDTNISFNLPLQRRFANGRMLAAQEAIAQINAETRYTQDLVVTDVRDAMSALVNAFERIELALQGVDVAQRVEDLERERFIAGGSSLLILNLREQATAAARLSVVDALNEYFKAVADYRAALALDVPLLPPTRLVYREPILENLRGR